MLRQPPRDVRSVSSLHLSLLYTISFLSISSQPHLAVPRAYILQVTHAAATAEAVEEEEEDSDEEDGDEELEQDLDQGLTSEAAGGLEEGSGEGDGEEGTDEEE